MKVRPVLKQIKSDGWYELPGNGSSHRQFKHKKIQGESPLQAIRVKICIPRRSKRFYDRQGYQHEKLSCHLRTG